MRGCATRLVGIAFCLGNDLVDTLLGVCLAQTGMCRNHLRHVGPIGRREVGVGGEIGFPQARHLGSDLCIIVLRSAGLSGCSVTKQFVCVKLYRVSSGSRLRAHAS